MADRSVIKVESYPLPPTLQRQITRNLRRGREWGWVRRRLFFYAWTIRFRLRAWWLRVRSGA